MIRLSPTAKTVKVTFVLPLGQTAGRCSVVGDFNELQLTRTRCAVASTAPDRPR